MKEIFSGVFAVLFLSIGLDLIHRHLRADLGIALAAQSIEDLQPLITTTELIVGENRFAFGLAKANKLLEKADVQLRIYSIDGAEPHLVAETNALYHPVGIVEGGERVHRHADGTSHVHRDATDVRGLYVTRLTFAHPGPWGIELRARDDNGSSATARLTVKVTNAPQSPALGTPAPRSRNLIASDVRDLREIDTSQKPDPRLHQVRIVDAIAQRKPQLIVFATPQFCTSRMCGPVVNIVRQLLPQYSKRVAFTHQEIWQDFAGKKPFPTVEEWRLVSEPWVFIVDGDGIIRAKFEGLVAVRELEQALQQTLQLNANVHR
ncbi:MAG TPA: hypothetical protein VHK27_06060 [Gammaproteobacteria bacterium]|nr:hypothetical protein [Gammaproteobacteria bacterium]